MLSHKVNYKTQYDAVKIAKAYYSEALAEVAEYEKYSVLTDE